MKVGSHQLDQKANTHSQIWVFDDLPWLYRRPLRTFYSSKGYSSQRTDAAITSVLRVDYIQRSHHDCWPSKRAGTARANGNHCSARLWDQARFTHQ